MKPDEIVQRIECIHGSGIKIIVNKWQRHSGEYYYKTEADENVSYEPDDLVSKLIVFTRSGEQFVFIDKSKDFIWHFRGNS